MDRLSEEINLDDYDLTKPSLPDDKPILEWGWQSFKECTPRLNEHLARLVTLNAALIGGSIFWLTASTMCGGFRVLVTSLFLFSLMLASYGLYPKGGEVDLYCADSILNMERWIIRRKTFWLKLSFGFMLVGFTSAIIGMIVKAWVGNYVTGS